MRPAAAPQSRFRALSARYREARQSLKTPASTQSRRGLDWMNFFLADVQTGFGTYVAFYLTHRRSVGLCPYKSCRCVIRNAVTVMQGQMRKTEGILRSIAGSLATIDQSIAKRYCMTSR